MPSSQTRSRNSARSNKPKAGRSTGASKKGAPATRARAGKSVARKVLPLLATAAVVAAGAYVAVKARRRATAERTVAEERSGALRTGARSASTRRKTSARADSSGDTADIDTPLRR